MKENQRIDWIDIAKGIGIILVVLGHCVVKTDFTHKFIFSFHMPLFFILSGYCFHVEKYENIKEVFCKRAKALLLPYGRFILVGLVVTLLIPQWRTALTVKGLLTDLYLGYPSSVHVTSIWYLVSLCGITVIYYILYFWAKKTGKNLILYLGVALSGMAGYAVYLVKSFMGVSDNATEAASKMSLPGGRLPLTVDASLTALVFFAIGVLFYQKQLLNKLKYKKIIVLVGFVLTSLVGGFLNTRVNIHGCSYGNIIYFYVCAIGGTIMVISLSQLIGEAAGAFIGKVKGILIFLGKNSLFMFAMQSLFVHLYVCVINEFTGEQYELYETLPTVYGMVGFVWIMVIGLPLSYLITEKIKKMCGAKG